MDTGSPSITKILTMVLFALSVIGLMLFLWLSFGGTIPFNPQGYEFKVSFTDASQLADQADVRIAGVTVGKVIAKELDPQGNRTIATIQMNNKFAPIHKDARAILRQKTILGETYVQLTTGTPHSPMLKDGGLLARSQVTNAVQLDQIFDALDPKTRAAFRQWQQQLAVARQGQRPEHLQRDRQPADVRRRHHGPAPGARRPAHRGRPPHPERRDPVRRARQGPAALRNLITSAETTFHTTAANNNAIAATFHVFPTFLDETRKTMTRLKGFSLDTDPLVKKLEPVARNLKPTLHDVDLLAPSLENFLTNLGPLITASKTGLPAISRDAQRGDAAARLPRAVPRAAQPDPHLALPAPAADLGLHLQRRRRPGRQDDELLRGRHRPLPAPVPAARSRDAVVRRQPRLGQPRQHLSAAAVAGRQARLHGRRQVPGQLRPPVLGLQQHRRRRRRLAAHRHGSRLS